MFKKNNYYRFIYILIFILIFIKIFEVKEEKNKYFSIVNNETSKESFKNKNIIINIGNKELSNEVFKTDYLNKMNNINMIVRNFNNRKELNDFYLNNSFSNISNNEEIAFRFMITNILERVKKNKIIYNFLINYLIKIIIIKGKSTLENGMPHTQSKNIIFPESYFLNITLKYKLNLINSLLENEGLTFMHEILHIHQRINPTKYIEMYKEWGFEKNNYIHNFSNFKEKNRHNPDGIELNWVLKINKKYYLIGAVYNNNPTNLNDVKYIANEILKIDNNIFNNIYKEIELYKFKKFMNFFGVTNNHYHPNEIASQYFEYYINEFFLNNNINNNTRAYNIFKKKINNILKITI